MTFFQNGHTTLQTNKKQTEQNKDQYYFGMDSTQKKRTRSTEDLVLSKDPKLPDENVLLSVVDWAGEEKARMLVIRSDTVAKGQEQIREQSGVPVRSQRLVLGEVKLEGWMRWDRFPDLRDGTTVHMTVVIEEVGAFDFY